MTIVDQHIYDSLFRNGCEPFVPAPYPAVYEGSRLCYFDVDPVRLRFSPNYFPPGVLFSAMNLPSYPHDLPPSQRSPTLLSSLNALPFPG